MTTEKVSLSLDQQLVEAARAKAGQRGLSGYVNDALRRQLLNRVVKPSQTITTVREWNLRKDDDGVA